MDTFGDGILDVHAQLCCADLEFLPQSGRQLGNYLFPVIGTVRGGHGGYLTHLACDGKATPPKVGGVPAATTCNAGCSPVVTHP
ncbi:hypothetical protein GCM10010353_50240 [Streptomyces chryseus]|nr:hypothetical protein GCM10010353_50240 [Streptomyces chryseus]